jgi:hypothetical protein
MSTYSRSSLDRLNTCEDDLNRLFTSVIEDYDNSILEGHRPEARQNELFDRKASKVRFPDGKHNSVPSKAVDSAPYIVGRGIPWPDKIEKPDTYYKDLAQFYHYAGYVQGKAKEMGIAIRWGGDWDKDWDLADQTFDDLVHFELTGD